MIKDYDALKILDKEDILLRELLEPLVQCLELFERLVIPVLIMFVLLSDNLSRLTHFKLILILFI